SLKKASRERQRPEGRTPVADVPGSLRRLRHSTWAGPTRYAASGTDEDSIRRAGAAAAVVCRLAPAGVTAPIGERTHALHPRRADGHRWQDGLSLQARLAVPRPAGTKDKHDLGMQAAAAGLVRMRPATARRFSPGAIAIPVPLLVLRQRRGRSRFRLR